MREYERKSGVLISFKTSLRSVARRTEGTDETIDLSSKIILLRKLTLGSETDVSQCKHFLKDVIRMINIQSKVRKAYTEWMVTLLTVTFNI